MKKIFTLVLCLFFLLPGVLCFAEPTPQPGSDPAPTANSVVERARQECGKPYQWGAVGPAVYDASGLVSYCLTGIHKRLGTTSTFLSWPRVSDPQPGDVCVSSEHCGIYIGGAQMIHAPTYGQVVSISSIQSDMIIVRYPGSDNADNADNVGEHDDNAIDTYLYLDGIEGEGNEPGHEKWIDLLTFMHGSSQSQESGSRGIFEPFTFKHLVDKATPQLQKYCMNGTKINSGEFHYCPQVGGQKEVVYAIKLEGITVTKAHVEIEDFPDGTFQLVEIVEMKVDKTTWTANDPLPEDPDSTVIEPRAPMGSTEMQRIRTLLDEYDRLAQNPAIKEKMDAVPGYGEWIVQLRARLAELERAKQEKENADSTDSNLSPATGIAGDDRTLPIALACIGSALIGLSVVCIRRKKAE